MTLLLFKNYCCWMFLTHDLAEVVLSLSYDALIPKSVLGPAAELQVKCAGNQQRRNDSSYSNAQPSLKESTGVYFLTSSISMSARMRACCPIPRPAVRKIRN